MKPCVIHFQTEEENAAALKEFLEGQRIIRKAKLVAAQDAKQCLPKLVEACRHKGNQSYHIRALLYSLWNGKPAKLIEVVNLDWELRCALVAVISAFGSDEFFYDQIKAAFVAAGLFNWFIEEGKQ